MHPSSVFSKKKKVLGLGCKFLSYKNYPDHPVADVLFRRPMSAAPFHIWFDQARLLGGDRYNAFARPYQTLSN